ncbi:uncharacterized protein LOC115645309 [Gopherus evgoodei]|uniref:uncharacterized protein LOC115645309 n=1 Tax=Gopherus evgoodei TaxID=1825980 RepID=UPI0011D020B7|nr:uncharacterized protein LOC115645309 [Gopherus evgoodei]
MPRTWAGEPTWAGSARNDHSLHINVRELRAVQLACQAFWSHLEGKMVQGLTADTVSIFISTSKAEPGRQPFARKLSGSGTSVCGVPFISWLCTSPDQEHVSKSSQQILLISPRMTIPSECGQCDLLQVGNSPSGLVRVLSEQEMPCVLLNSRDQERLPVRRLFTPTVGGSDVHSPVGAINPQGSNEDQTRQGKGNPDSSDLALPTLVRRSVGPLGGDHTAADALSGSAVSDHGSLLHPSLAVSAVPDSLAAAWLNVQEQECPACVQQVLLCRRKLYTRVTYLARWKRFTCCALDQDIWLEQASLQLILDCLLHLKLQGFSLSSIDVTWPLFQPCTLHSRTG